ncbi:MAG: DNA excision repair protein ERCC-2 [Gammaproteobacteria bacterium]|jgi:DNA excision repair protein ERCC-2
MAIARQTQKVKIGIRQLAEFCCRNGDLGGDGLPSVNAQQGLQTHQKIQQRYAASADKEVTVSHLFDIDGYQIELSGRIDLVFRHEKPPRIEEIKTVYHFQKNLEDSNDPHWAQLKCYGSLYAMEHELEEVYLSLNYVNLFNHQEHQTPKEFLRLELELFVQQLLKKYLQWYDLVIQHQNQTRDTAIKLEFPFKNFRSQQREFAAQVFRSVQNQHRLMVEAPTGSGKTISTLFPAVKAIGEDHCDQIIYLSAKTSGQKQATIALDHMITNGLDINYLCIQAKAKACPCNSNPAEIDESGKCLRCIGFFDRLSAGREDLFRQQIMDSETIQSCAEKYKLCPFELSLQMLPWAQVVICDLNYVFDPLVQLSYFRQDKQRKVLLIDELHNLVDRARGMYSGSIHRDQIHKAIQASQTSKLLKPINQFSRQFNQLLLSLDDEQWIDNQPPEALLESSYKFIEKLGMELFSNKLISSETVDLTKAVFRLQRIGQLFGDHHSTIATKTLLDREVKVVCLNAFEYLAEVYELFHSVCGFSATLAPIGYFHQALGLGENTFQLKLRSSFPPENLKACVGSFVDTRYRYRDQAVDTICHSIQRCYHIKPGNYLIFFSSYRYMEQVQKRFSQLFPHHPTLMQKRNADDETRQIFLNEFFQGDNNLGFAIMGGIFAEGIDYRGKALIGSIVVGVGLPHPGIEQNLIENDFKSMSLNGFDFAYRYPGLIRVQQSAGRVIRSDTDKGVIILLDRRFEQSAYQSLLPDYWNMERCQSLDQLEQQLQQFWSASNQSSEESQLTD